MLVNFNAWWKDYVDTLKRREWLLLWNLFIKRAEWRHEDEAKSFFATLARRIRERKRLIAKVWVPFMNSYTTIDFGVHWCCIAESVVVYIRALCLVGYWRILQSAIYMSLIICGNIVSPNFTLELAKFGAGWARTRAHP